MGLGHEVARLRLRLAEVERRQDNTLRHGVVAEVDPAKGTVRLKVGKNTDGTDVLSPKIPYGQMAGGLKVHAPPTVGQNMTMFSPGGEMEQAIAMPFTWNNANKSPSSSGDENVLTFGDVKVTLLASSVRFEIGGFVFELSAAGMVAEGGRLEHDGLDIGSTHKHGGVMPGAARTLVPDP